MRGTGRFDSYFLPFSRLLPIHRLVVPEFTKFWDELEPSIVCNAAPMVKRLLIGQYAQ